MKKKEEERRYLGYFLDLRPDLKFEEIQEDERPDFVCSTNGKTIGIELTRFFFPSKNETSSQAMDAYRQQLAQELRIEHIRRNLPAITVYVHLYEATHLINKATRQVLKAELLDFVSANLEVFDKSACFGHELLPENLMDKGVDQISVLRLPTLTDPFWALSHAEFIPESRSSLIQAIVSEKSAHISEYRKKASTVWLVIISGTGGLGSIIDFDHDVLTATYQSNFERVFLFRTYGRSVHELKLAGTA